MEGHEYGLGETWFILTARKGNAKRTPSQNFLSLLPLSLRGAQVDSSYRDRILTYTPSLPLLGSHGVSSSGAEGGQLAYSPPQGAECCYHEDRGHSD